MNSKQSKSDKISVFTHRNRQVHIPDEHLAVGVIVGVHGLRGEVKVELHTDFPERFQAGVELFLGETLIPFRIESARPHKNHMLIRFDQIRNREAAEELRNQWIFVHEEQAVELDEDTFWVHDIIGLNVRTEENLLLGTVTDVLFTGANEVYLVEPEGTINNGREILLPAIADVIQSVDLEAGELIVRLQAGLIEQE